MHVSGIMRPQEKEIFKRNYIEMEKKKPNKVTAKEIRMLDPVYASLRGGR